MSWLKDLPELLARNNLAELIRMASIADDVNAMIERCNHRVSALELDLAARHYGEEGVNITKLINAITAGTSLAQVYYNTAALTRPATQSGPQCYVVVAPDRAKALDLKGEWVREYYDLYVWTRPAQTL